MWVGIVGVRWGVSDSEFPQVVYTKPLDICYDSAAVLNLIFWLAPFWEMGALGGRRLYCWVGSGMFPKAVSTNHRCIWHRLAAICDASFDWGMDEPPVWVKGWS